MSTGTKIHLGLKRYHAQLRQQANDALNGHYQPLNPATYGEPAPAPQPFLSISPKVREWADARQRREAAEACRAIVAVSEPVAVSAELVVYRTEHFRVVYTEHWAEQRMCYEVLSVEGAHIYYYFDEETACRRADEAELFRAWMASCKTLNHALEHVPF